MAIKDTPPRQEQSESRWIGAQEWLDLNREAGYADALKEIAHAIDEGTTAGDYLQNLIDSVSQAQDAQARGSTPIKLTAKERASIEFQTVHSDYASKIAGVDIVRPVFVSRFTRTYKKIEKTIGMLPGVSGGMIMHRDMLGELPQWRHAPIIIAKDQPSTIVHEIQHSIDPHFSERTGYNEIIGELLAFSASMRRDWSHTTPFLHERLKQMGSAYDIDFQEMLLALTDKLYFNKMSSSVPENERMSYLEWHVRVGKITDALQTLIRSSDETSAMRQVMQVKTIDELLALPLKTEPSNDAEGEPTQ